MRNVQLFLAASLGCLILAAIMFDAPDAVLNALFPNSNAAKVMQCRRLLKTHDETRKWPDKGSADYISYGECYYLICGGTRPAV